MDDNFLNDTSASGAGNSSSSFGGFDPFYSSSNHHALVDDGHHQFGHQTPVLSDSTPSSTASSSARASSEQHEYVPTYSEAFPPLPDQLPAAGTPGLASMPPHYVQQSQAAARIQQRQKQQPMPVHARAPGSAWPPQDTADQQYSSNGGISKNGVGARGVGARGSVPQAHVTKALASSKRNEIIVVPLEERRMLQKSYDSRSSNNSRPSEVAASEMEACRKIREETGVDVEAEVTGSNGLRIMLYGRESAIADARLLVKRRLLTEATIIVRIPKEHHKLLLGKRGERLNEIQGRTGTKINIPQMNDQSDEIKVIGSRECTAQARRELQSISDIESKRGFERLVVPKIYHAFIRGARNSTVMALQQRYPDVKINMPPLNVESDELTIVGDKENVQAVKMEIERIYRNVESTSGTLSIQIPAQRHKYLLQSKGEALHQILEKTGVTVQLPSKIDGSENVLLRGDRSKLGAAVSMLIDQANSVQMLELACPGWLQPRLIGRGGETVKELNVRYPDVHVAFETDENKIRLEGPQQQVDIVFQEMSRRVAEMQNMITFQNVKVGKPELVKHIIGKSGANMNRLREAHKVQFHIPDAGKASDDVIRVEGSKEGVDAAVAELKELISRMENETTKDIPIDYRLHRIMIGQKGGKVDEIRNKFPQVHINFPESSLKSSVVQLRGPKDEVEKCSKYMQQHAKTMAEQNHQVEVPVVAVVVSKVIGKGGVNIAKIRDETNTRIEMPNEKSGEPGTIRITGRKADVEKARKTIQAIQDEQANLVELSVNIPHKLHNALIGPKGLHIRAITEECGNAHIKFPPTGNEQAPSDVVIIRGPKADAEKAKRKLVEAVEVCELNGYTVELKVDPELHRYVIGKGGSNIKRVRNEYNVQVDIPGRTDNNNDTIVIVGQKENVEKAREDIESLVKEMADITEYQVHVPREYQTYLSTSINRLYNELESKFGGDNNSNPVNISIMPQRKNNNNNNNNNNSKVQDGSAAPPSPDNSDEMVVLRGSTRIVDYAKQHIGELIDKWKKYITDFVHIPAEFQRQVIGQRGQHVNEICRKYDVQIKFPERPQNNNRGDVSYDAGNRRGGRSNNKANSDNAEYLDSNNDSNNNLGDQSRSSDEPSENSSVGNSVADLARSAVRITGIPEAIEMAKQALLALVPVQNEMQVPFKYHRLLIGPSGATLQEFQKKHQVNVKVPRQELKSDTIIIVGTQQKIDAARIDIQNFLDDFERDNFTLQVSIDPNFHHRVIGTNGENIKKLREKYDVNIRVPRDGSNIVTITGPEENAHRARDMLEKLAADYASEVKYEVDIDPRVHRRIIGASHAGLRQLMKDFSVHIKFPTFDQEDALDKVYVTGSDDNATKCIEQLTKLEEEFLERELEAGPGRGGGGDRGGGRGGRSDGGGRGGSRGGAGGGQRNAGAGRSGGGDNAAPARGFAVRDAPWQNEVPNASSFDDFPSFAIGSVAEKSSGAAVAASLGAIGEQVPQQHNIAVAAAAAADGEKTVVVESSVQQVTEVTTAGDADKN